MTGVVDSIGGEADGHWSDVVWRARQPGAEHAAWPHESTSWTEQNWRLFHLAYYTPIDVVLSLWSASLVTG